MFYNNIIDSFIVVNTYGNILKKKKKLYLQGRNFKFDIHCLSYLN